jgi:NADPH:quinone reductase
MIYSGNVAYITEMAKIIVPLGRIASITESSKDQNRDALKTKNVSFSWEFIFIRSMIKTPYMIARHHLLNVVARAVDSREMSATISQNLGIIIAQNLRHAHQLIESARTVGKIALSVFRCYVHLRVTIPAPTCRSY